MTVSIPELFETNKPTVGLAKERIPKLVATLSEGVATGQFVAMLESPFITRLCVPVDFAITGSYGTRIGV